MEASAAGLDWTLGSAAARLVDWRTAEQVGRRVAGPGIPVPPAKRAEIRERFARVVPEAEALVAGFTGIEVAGPRARPWVMSRGEWIGANLRALQTAIKPLAARVLGDGRPRPGMRRKALGAELGMLLGYVSRKVIGQYDLFLAPDDEGLLYFVGPNVVEMEQRFRLPAEQFRLWISLHEVAHRVQFAGAPWLRGHVVGAVDAYLRTVDLDLAALVRQLKRAVEEARSSDEWRDLGWVFLLLNDEQRDLFQRMQAVMSVLEGHASYAMNGVGRDRIPGLDRLRRSLKRRRTPGGVEKAFQRAIGFDTKVRQYDAGERFVAAVVERGGMATFNRVWERPEHFPDLDEIAHPDRWIARVLSG